LFVCRGVTFALEQFLPTLNANAIIGRSRSEQPGFMNGYFPAFTWLLVVQKRKVSAWPLMPQKVISF
jgi:hypothetical protein